MKLFTLYNNNILSDNNAEDSALIDNAAPIIATSPDTAIIKDGRPFFVPDFTERCCFLPAFAVRISRLGHSISERFAHRYYDATTAGVRFFAADLLSQAQRGGLPWSFATGFDGSAAIGQFVEAKGIDAMHLSIYLDGNELFSVDGLGLSQTLDRAVAHISRYYTLRQGDMLFCCTSADRPEPAVENSRLTATIDGRQILAFNIK